MAGQMKCVSCGSKLDEKAKFCAGCGTPAPKKAEVGGTHLTTDVLLDHLREEGEDLGDLVFQVGGELHNGRSQSVFITVNIDEDGETEYDKLSLYSYFAPANFNAKRAIAAVNGRWFGVTNDGGDGGFQLTTSLRIETLTSLESFSEYVLWIAMQADTLEEELTGSDVF